MEGRVNHPVVISEEAFLLCTPVERTSVLNRLTSWWWEKTSTWNTGDFPSSECPPVHSSLCHPLHLLCLLHPRGEEFPQLFQLLHCYLETWPRNTTPLPVLVAQEPIYQILHRWCHFKVDYKDPILLDTTCDLTRDLLETWINVDGGPRGLICAGPSGWRSF